MRELLDRIPEGRLVGWTQALLRVPSVQTERFEADPGVQQFIAGCVRPMLEGEGIACRLDAMGNLLAETGPAGASRSALLLAYAMTHPASSMKEPFAGELLEREGRRLLRGRGVAEQKGSLAAAMAAFVAYSRMDPAARVTLAVSTAGETGQHKAATAILEGMEREPQLAILAIGTSGRISTANKGRLDVHIEVAGRSSHSSTPWLGVDAIAGARAVMDRLAALDLGGKRHPLLGEATLTPTAIRSFPEATHTLQNLVRLTYDRRLLPGQEPDEALAGIRAALADLGPWKVSVSPGALQYPAEIPDGGAFMRAARAGAERLGLDDPGTFVSHGCVDAGLLVRRGCEAAMWGPGDAALWHTDDESLPVADLVKGAAGYLGFLLEVV